MNEILLFLIFLVFVIVIAVFYKPTSSETTPLSPELLQGLRSTNEHGQKIIYGDGSKPYREDNLLVY